MTTQISTRHRYALLLLGLLTAAVIAMTTLPSTSRADLWSGSLAGKTWTTNGDVFTLHEIFARVESGPSAICVGPVQYSGGWVFPYGWDCSSGSVDWQFAAINAAGGVDNPNSGGDTYLAADS